MIRATRPRRAGARSYAEVMGAIGSGPFENDDALEFLDGLAHLPPGDRPARVLAALDGVLLTTSYVEAPQMCEGVAGAALVGASTRPWLAAGEPHLPIWVELEPLPADEELIEKSRQVLRRAVRSHDNEWWELWEEAGLADDVVASCRRALSWLGDRDD
jgi:hypothetical protein